MLPLICDLQSIEEAGTAVIQEFGFVTLKDDYGSASNPVVLCRLAQQLLLQFLLELFLHHPAGCKLLEYPRNKSELWADGFPSNELSDELCPAALPQLWSRCKGKQIALVFLLIKGSLLDVACKLENVVMAKELPIVD